MECASPHGVQCLRRMLAQTRATYFAECLAPRGVSFTRSVAQQSFASCASVADPQAREGIQNCAVWGRCQSP
eukprot:3370359-Pyramimonas_sp.AAC.1